MVNDNEGARIRRLIISVAQLDRSIVFYRDALGLTLSRQSEGFAWLATGDDVEILLHERETAANGGSVSIAFTVNALDDVVADWASRGGGIIDEPQTQPWGERMAVVTDADGHIVCLCEQAP